MNVYVRYFGQEAFLHNAEEVIDFLSTIQEINVTPQMIADVTAYVNGDMPYPKRYKVRPRVYFIMIKTSAASMEEFRANNRNNQPQETYGGGRETGFGSFVEERRGWYRANMLFKRVIQVPVTGKFQYQDTPFVAVVWANSVQHCYSRVIDHLKNRQDVDYRSQYPSIKGSNFDCEFLGEEVETIAG